ncbi:FAD/NAD(P)-binding domain-containing protein [Hypoxylon sp. NC1633]|nr:FAD/NAD(P)-binding domain-containing protein [Hypoxylon sp. NC1633]
MGSSSLPSSHTFPSATAAPQPFNVRRIAVVGAGPSGLAAAKYLLAQEGAFPQIDVFEQQAEVGGVWNYSAVPRPVEELPVPQTDALPLTPDPPVYAHAPGADADGEGVGTEGTREGKGKPLFPSPMYDHLNTNIPHTIMKYSDLSFPAECEIFPKRQDVQEYLVAYARDVRHLIQFSTQVTDIALQHPITTNTTLATTSLEQDQWDVRTTNLLTGDQTTQTYDAVVVASGHYATPFIPNTCPDIAGFRAAHPGLISHSKLYRSAEAYRGKKVVVVGTGASGLDIASQIQAVCKPPLLMSARTRIPPDTLRHIGHVRQVGQIRRFLVAERGVEFAPLPSDSDSDSDAEAGNENEASAEIDTETDIDAILFCTGYLYTFPFLSSLSPSSPSPSSISSPSTPLITTGRRVHNLAKHFLHIPHPTLAFPGLPIKVIPFPLAEAQAAVLARLWSNALPLPPPQTLEAWARADGEGTSPGKYHVFSKGGDGRYINELHEWVVGGGQSRNIEGGGEGSGKVRGGGKEPPFWDEELLWQRSVYIEAKMQFERTGRKAKTLEELGFRFVPKEVLPLEPGDVEGREPREDVAG